MDKVKFKLQGEIITGTVYWIDKNGTFENPGVESYDILSDDGVLYKHVPKHMLI